MSGIEIALWDLAGKLLNVSVVTLLGGKFRDRIRVYHDEGPRNMLAVASCREWAQKVKADPAGFTAHKFGFQHTNPNSDAGRDLSNKLLSTKELISLRAMGVTPSYIKQISDAGYKNLTAKDLTSLRAMGVTPEFIKSLADAGYTNLSVKDLTRMAAVGVNADFIRDLTKYRTK